VRQRVTVQTPDDAEIERSLIHAVRALVHAPAPNKRRLSASAA
jgi:hypothetical protein